MISSIPKGFCVCRVSKAQKSSGLSRGDASRPAWPRIWGGVYPEAVSCDVMYVCKSEKEKCSAFREGPMEGPGKRGLEPPGGGASPSACVRMGAGGRERRRDEVA
jgi:hypothetical protein